MRYPARVGEYTFGKRTIKTSSEDRVVFPGAGITKGEVVAYYHRIDSLILPHLDGRALTMERFPKGLGEKSFYNKHAPGYFPKWIERVDIDGRDGRIVCQIPADASVMLVWSPGGDGAVMPEGVGMELSGGEEEWLILATHYLSSGGAGAERDRSGVDFCVTETPPPSTAGIVVFGTADISIPPLSQGHEVQTTCIQRRDFPLTAIATSPHMHNRGRAIRSELQRDGETVAMLTDVPLFDPDRQSTATLDPAIVLEPDDRIRTTCVYDNDSVDTIRYGVGLASEMCFDYVLAYPIDQWPTKYSRVCW